MYLQICDSENRIISVNARFPGGKADTVVWGACKEKAYLESRWSDDERFHLLADRAYPLQPWVMTPFRRPEDFMPQRFNTYHSVAHNLIKETSAMLRSRFRCLIDKKLRYAPNIVSKIINVCCAMHNLCQMFVAKTFVMDNEPLVPRIGAVPINPNPVVNTLEVGERIRNELMHEMARINT